MPTILIVEDDQRFREGLHTLLTRAEYHVIASACGDSVRQLVRVHEPDIILLDVMLPGASGFDVCRWLRQTANPVPVILMSCRRVEEYDRVFGLTVGADDYLVKPFGSAELLARISARLRRCTFTSASTASFSFGDVAIDFSLRTASRAGSPLALTTKEYEVLEVLIAHRGEVVSREELLQKVWGYGNGAVSRTVDTHIFTLRQKLEADPRNPRHIRSERGTGYMFI